MTPRLLLLSALLTAALLLCGTAFPAHYLAFCLILAALSLFAGLKLWWDCWRAAKEYREEHFE